MSALSTKYNRQCLDDKLSKCSDAEKTAALMDYVGATRGEKGKVKFDGKLTAEEKAYVENKFGTLVEFSPEVVDMYIDQANRKFFEDHTQQWKNAHPEQSTNPYKQDPKICKEGKALTILEYRHYHLGHAIAMDGPHRCHEDYANKYFNSGLELKIAANPKKQYFAIEGHSYLSKHQAITKDLTTANPLELVFFERIADELNIPISEATPTNSSHPQSVKLASKKNGLSENEYMATILIKRFQPRGINIYQAIQAGIANKSLPSNFSADSVDWNKLWEETIASVSKEYDLDAKEQAQLKQSLFDFVGILPNFDGKINITPYALFSKDPAALARNAKVEKRWSELIEASNELSVNQVRKDIKNSKKKEAFFLLGYGHRKIPEDVYKETPKKK